MKFLHLKQTLLLAGIAGFLVLPVTSQAAVIAVDDATFTPALDSGTTMLVDTTYDLASFTVGTTTYTDLEGATASGQGAIPNGSYVFGTSSADPGYYNDPNAAMTGLDFSRGFANPDSDIIFQFSQALQNYQGFAGFEGDGNNAFELSLVDASGTAVGDYTLSANTYGADLAQEPAGGWYRPQANNPNRLSGALEPKGTFFTLADFNGTTGDLSTATGFKLTGNTGIDPFAVVAVIPEPNATALLLGAGACLLLLRRRRLGA